MGLRKLCGNFYSPVFASLEATFHPPKKSKNENHKSCTTNRLLSNNKNIFLLYFSITVFDVSEPFHTKN